MLSQRFWSKVDQTDSCWNWTACKNTDGYGYFWHEKKCRYCRVCIKNRNRSQIILISNVSSGSKTLQKIVEAENK